MGSPNGAICSRYIFSPGTHPISISFKKISLLSNSLMIASCPGFKSDNFIFNQCCKAKFTELHFLTNFEIMSSGLVSRVNFFFDGVAPAIRNRRSLKQFIIAIFRSEKRKLESITYVLSTDKTVHKINKEYLNHDELTDIITFNLSEKGKPIIGEIYISVNRVKENAIQHGTSFTNELHRVIFHGVLHLCGFGDKTVSEIRKMRKKENYYLTKYFS